MALTFIFEELNFTPHPEVEGAFESELFFDNNWGLRVFCGTNAYTFNETEIYSTANEYSEYEYWIHKPIDFIPLEEGQTIGPLTKEEIIEVATEIKNRPWVQGWSPGGVGE
jgi:hypothetical protein